MVDGLTRRLSYQKREGRSTKLRSKVRLGEYSVSTPPIGQPRRRAADRAGLLPFALRCLARRKARWRTDATSNVETVVVRPIVFGVLLRILHVVEGGIIRGQVFL